MGEPFVVPFVCGALIGLIAGFIAGVVVVASGEYAKKPKP